MINNSADELTPLSVLTDFSQQQKAQTAESLRNQPLSEDDYVAQNQESAAQLAAKVGTYAEVAKQFLALPDKRDRMMQREKDTPVGTMYRNLSIIEAAYDRGELGGDRLNHAVIRVVTKCVSDLEAAKLNK